ncbi:SDR family oxidoreductase [Candidatus Methylopumilus universalis]|uniref:SDR family oxidoreductase n=2 Tax=Candidatus Methylopumilus universalis TaxID=2588536 RepID=A0ABX5VTQ1_9PROT|nr:SDR family oxidoreductase [Candidatus Methylopumilus universalis]QDC51238.1 SDR family oxidoreductase [Candidatus Methylopumilus universalis]QDC61376.1 SDR family oxidoreductase [Candidatus Methylopumilus universalis]
MKNRVLLTGGLGYVGGRVALALRDSGFDVYCGTRRIELKAPKWFPEMQMLHVDWESRDSLVNLCQEVDFVVHLSAMNEIESIRDPVGALKINGLASLNLLEAAKLSGVSRFVYFSTAHVYGSPLQGLIDESTLPRPIHPYAITHKVAEDFVLAAHDSGEIEGVVVRLSNCFGAPVTSDIERWTLLVNDLCRQAVITGKLRLNSSGSQLRDFITLDDVARAVCHLLKLDRCLIADGLFNLGGDMAISIFEMTERVAARWKLLTGHEIEIIRPISEHLSSPMLKYRCDKLFSTGFNLTSEVDREIDDTLSLCRQAF